MQCRNELPSREARAICVEENDPLLNQLSIIPFFNFQFRRLSSPNSIPDTDPDPGGSILLTLAGFCNRQFQFTPSLVRGRRWIRVHGPPTNDDLPSRQSHRPLPSFPSFPPDPTSSQPASRTHISLPCHAGWEGGRPARPVAATDEVAKQRCAARRHRASATAVGDRDRHRATAGGDGGLLLMGQGGREGQEGKRRAATSNCGMGCAPHSCEV